MRFISLFFVTVFGVGYSPFAPGTAGAIVACTSLWLFEKLNLLSTTSTPILFIGLIIITTIVGIVASNQLENELGKDASIIVIDEVIGMWIIMLFVPLTWLTILIGFILFRFFDILKPLGIKKMENFNGGLGVMADDMLAGIYSNILLLIIVRFL